MRQQSFVRSPLASEAIMAAAAPATDAIGDVHRLFALEKDDLTHEDVPARLMVLDTRRGLLSDELRGLATSVGEASSSPVAYDVVLADGVHKVRRVA